MKKWTISIKNWFFLPVEGDSNEWTKIGYNQKNTPLAIYLTNKKYFTWIMVRKGGINNWSTGLLYEVKKYIIYIFIYIYIYDEISTFMWWCYTIKIIMAFDDTTNSDPVRKKWANVLLKIKNLFFKSFYL